MLSNKAGVKPQINDLFDNTDNSAYSLDKTSLKSKKHVENIFMLKKSGHKK